MNISGDNFVKLIGIVKYKKVTSYDNGSTSFKCSLAIPSPNNDGQYQYVKVSSWIKEDDDLNIVPNGTWLKIMGHIEEKSYDSNCKYCNGPDKKYWTDVVIDNYIILGGN